MQKQREALPEMDIYTYPTGHAFNRDIDPTHYDAASAKLALQRTLEFFDRHLACLKHDRSRIRLRARFASGR